MDMHILAKKKICKSLPEQVRTNNNKLSGEISQESTIWETKKEIIRLKWITISFSNEFI